MFIWHPRLYLRLSFTLDLAFSRGAYPRESDLPALVRELPSTEKPLCRGASPFASLPEGCSSTPGSNFQRIRDLDEDMTGQEPDAPESPQRQLDEALKQTALPTPEEDSRQAATTSASPDTGTEPPTVFTFDQGVWGSPSPSARAETSSRDQTAMPPPVRPGPQSLHAVNLDFLDLRNLSVPAGDCKPTHAQEPSGGEQPSWPGTVLDDILNVISG
jgi:hypothetical protein